MKSEIKIDIKSKPLATNDAALIWIELHQTIREKSSPCLEYTSPLSSEEQRLYDILTTKLADSLQDDY